MPLTPSPGEAPESLAEQLLGLGPGDAEKILTTIEGLTDREARVVAAEVGTQGVGT